jgi:hypothetical protein
MLEFRGTLTIAAAFMALSVIAAPTKLSAATATDEEIGAAFNEADLNGDGILEIDEYVAYMVNLFASLDKDRDGFLVIAEIPETPPERFRQYDRNGDNKISLGEGVGFKVVEFFDADVNNDGVMSLAELLALEQKIAAS